MVAKQSVCLVAKQSVCPWYNMVPLSSRMQARWFVCLVRLVVPKKSKSLGQWPDFVFNLKACLNAADGSFEQDLSDIEATMDRAVDPSIEQDDYVKRSQELHSVLVGLLRNRLLKVLRGVERRNGYEVYRKLLKFFTF